MNHFLSRRRLAKCIMTAASIMVLAVAGCGTATGTGPLGAPQSPAATGSAGQCTIYDSGHDAQIVVTQGGQAECDALSQSLSSGGDFWTSQPQATSDQLAVVCVMDSNGNEAEVVDGGGQIIGTSICASMRGSGWTENTAAEQQLAQQAASASAAASSAAAQQAAQQQQAQQVQKDQQTASSDIASLASAVQSMQSDLQSMNGDVSSAASDLQSLKNDAAQGQGDQCINVSTTVYNDAATTLFNDEQTTILNDLQTTLSNDLSTVRGDISSVQSDVQTLQADGVSVPPTGVSDAQNAVASVITQASANNATVAGYVGTGYQIANSLAYGACSGMGPGSPPTPPGNLS